MLDAIYNRRDSPAATPIRLAVVLSLLVHMVVIGEWLPHMRLPSFDLPERSEEDGRLTVRLAPLPGPPPALPPPPAPRARPRLAPPPVTALKRPAPAIPSPPPAVAPPAVPSPASPLVGGDLSSFIEARRRARAESASAASGDNASNAPPTEDERARANRIASANLAPQRQITFGYDPARSGGVFTIERVSHDHAEFTFVGWNSDIRRRTKQLIEVRKGGHGDIRLAVVRRMIAIIRQYEPEEFLWDSQRLGRSLTLSSRERDSAGLEDFMLLEFFTASHQPE